VSYFALSSKLTGFRTFTLMISTIGFRRFPTDRISTQLRCPRTQSFSIPAVLLFLIAVVMGRPARAQTVTTIAAGSGAGYIAINPVTNRIYIANEFDNTVTVINGSTNATTTVPVGTLPIAAAVNSVTNKIYVVNQTDETVTVIDGTSNTTTTVPSGPQPEDIAVNTVTNKIYVADFMGTLTVIDGATNQTTNVPAGVGTTLSVAVDPVTNTIWVNDAGAAEVTAIDGTTFAATNVPLSLSMPAMRSAVHVVVNPVTDLVYVLSAAVGTTAGNVVTVIDPTMKVPNVEVTDDSGNTPGSFAWGNMVVNSAANVICLNNPLSNDVTLINGTTNAVTNVPVGMTPYDIAVDPSTNTIYASNIQANSVTVIDGVSDMTTTVPVGNNPTVLAVNPTTHTVYVINQSDHTVSVFGGASGTSTPTPTPTPTPPPGGGSGGGGGSGSARLINISTRAEVGTGANILIPGFVISGNGTETLLIRADGPALTGFGVAGALAQPSLSVFDSSGTVVASNTGWGTNTNPAQISSAASSVGAFALASGSADCALLASLPAGAYTVQVSGVSNSTGVALAEVYEVSSGGTRLANISTRALVGTGANIIIPGFVISGSGSEQLLARGDGPALTGFGVAGALAQPSLSVFDSSGAVIASNTGWGTNTNPAAITSAGASVGAFALASGSADSALVVNVSAGAYTMQLSGVNNSTGVALAEVYEVP
jgi:YVTN family beta-propeller protein